MEQTMDATTGIKDQVVTKEDFKLKCKDLFLKGDAKISKSLKVLP